MKKTLSLIIFCVSIIFATEGDPASSYSLPTDRLPINAFDNQDPRLKDFEEMCQEISKIVNKRTSYFISYAWANEQFESGCCLRSWINAVFIYLEKSGLDVFYDTAGNSYTGWLPDMKQQLIARKVIVFLTPDYDFKCNKGSLYSLSEEAEIVFSKHHTERKFVLLCGTDRQSLPQKYRGSYPPNSETLHMLTDSPYGKQQANDVPSMNSFFKVMCNLLDPTKQWGLLYHLSDDDKPQCLKSIDTFKNKYLNFNNSVGISNAGSLSKIHKSVFSSHLKEQIVSSQLGHQEQRENQFFMRGKIFYKPKLNNDDHPLEFNIADLACPLSNEFDLSLCGNIAKYLSLHTGYKKNTNIEENKGKLEVWIVPRYLIQRDIKGTAQHYQGILEQWSTDNPIAVFFTLWDWPLDQYLYSINPDYSSKDENLLYHIFEHSFKNKAPGIMKERFKDKLTTLRLYFT